MLQFRVLTSVLLLGCVSAFSAASIAEESPVTVYPAAFFAGAQPSSAFDMLAVLPGYELDEGDADVRGFAGAMGNVLIDGSRPAGKQESLESILRRIAANAVERIELIQVGATNVDMQGHRVLANIVRKHEAQTRAAIELASTFYERDFDAPRVAAELSRRSGKRAIELSAAVFDTVDDEHGIGRRPRIGADGTLLRDARYTQDEGESARQVAAVYENEMMQGQLRLNASLLDTEFGADIVQDLTFPVVSRSTVREFEDQREWELGASFERRLSSNRQLELFVLHRASSERGGEREIDDECMTLFREDADGSESIIRGVLRSQLGRVMLESGLEGALNVLDSRSSLDEDGIAASLPNGSARVEERRVEAFAGAKWPLSTTLRVEAGSRFEHSSLEQSGGGNRPGKSFFFPKPRVLLTWSPTPNDGLRLLLEREVGQLDFDDFVGSASLSSGTVSAGNPDLEPDRTWRIELAWERRFMEAGALIIAARHERIEDLVDRIPVVADEPFDAVGNIGDGARSEIELSLTLPLDRFGIRAGLFKTNALWRHSEATDPTTGRVRPISAEPAREASLHFSQQLARLRVRWGVDAVLASEVHEYYFDEIRSDRLGARLDVFAQYDPTPVWHIRLFANNLTDRSSVREREIYAGIRNAHALDYVETRTLAIGPYVGFSVRRDFGQ